MFWGKILQGTVRGIGGGGEDEDIHKLFINIPCCRNERIPPVCRADGSCGEGRQCQRVGGAVKEVETW